MSVKQGEGHSSKLQVNNPSRVSAISVDVHNTAFVSMTSHLGPTTRIALMMYSYAIEALINSKHLEVWILSRILELDHQQSHDQRLVAIACASSSNSVRVTQPCRGLCL